MSWPKGRRRAECDAADFIRRLSAEVSLRQIAAAAGVTDRTVRRWRDGERFAPAESLTVLIDRLWPGVWSRQPKLRDSEVGPTTWVVGVGEATRRAAATGRWDAA